MAIIAVKPGRSLTEAETHAHCEANLARFKRLRLIKFVMPCRATPPARSTSRRCASNSVRLIPSMPRAVAS
jgi:hypothetical protein